MFLSGPVDLPLKPKLDLFLAVDAYGMIWIGKFEVGF